MEQYTEKFFSIKEVAHDLEVHPNTVRLWITKGWLKSRKVGCRIRIYESDLNEFLDRWN